MLFDHLIGHVEGCMEAGEIPEKGHLPKPGPAVAEVIRVHNR
jgi:hypothetical protein